MMIYRPRYMYDDDEEESGSTSPPSERVHIAAQTSGAPTYEDAMMAAAQAAAAMDIESERKQPTPKGPPTNAAEITTSPLSATRRLKVKSDLKVHLPKRVIIKAKDPSDVDPRLRFQIRQTLRDTIFGKVVLANDFCTNKQVAIKLSNKMQVREGIATNGERVVENTMTEAAIMKRLPPHPNVLSLVDEFQDETTHAMVLEYAPGGELFDLISKIGHYDEPVARNKFREIVEGVDHLHRNGVCHLDLSLENILIGADDKLKICDFGVARIIPNGKFPPCIYNKPGKITYMCPELLAGRPFDGRQADSFGLGVILFILLTGLPPFEVPSMADKRFEWIWRGHLIPLIKKFGVDHLVPDAAADLLRRLLCHPDDRLMTHEILAHPWMLEGRDVDHYENGSRDAIMS